ncbi:TetR/AcrR family transcriptional regulator [Tabrizicola sp.]|uniref:TetR/AcrR family transcriptional regulator n=1 Tax=Tabrizicola sp. TaxID=2005166 RepID=UPI0035B1A222
MSDEPSTRERLVQAATRLFRQRGYDGTGLAEILAEAGVPKGSLYHHFPDGKADLACAAADWTASEIIRVIDDSFRAVPDWRQGVTTFCYKMAKLFDILDSADACPIFGLLFEGPDHDRFRAQAEQSFDRIIAAAAHHGEALGMPAGAARDAAETFIIGFQGSWTLARARRKSDVLRGLPARLYGPLPPAAH